MSEESEIETTTIGETPNYIVWSALEEDGEETFHIELGATTLHFFREEWEEFLELFRDLV